MTETLVAEADGTRNRDGLHRVALVATEQSSPFELGVTQAVFGRYLSDVIPDRYALRICAEEGKALPLTEGTTLTTPYGLEELSRADTVIIPSSADVDVPPSDRLLAAIGTAHRRGARIVSTCTGAFVLAATGLLDGRRATTHWRYADLLRSRHPQIDVDPSPLYVDEGDVLTSAGSAASLDLCLHLVRKDFGAEFANTVARRLVIQPHREGGQAQFIEMPVAPAADDDGVARSIAWALEHLSEPISIPVMARTAQMSLRSYVRHFAQVTGSSPKRWLISQRVRASLPLLESSQAPIEEVSAAVGFESADTFRLHFSRIMRTPPSSYRKGFRSVKAAQDAAAELDRAVPRQAAVSAGAGALSAAL